MQIRSMRAWRQLSAPGGAVHRLGTRPEWRRFPALVPLTLLAVLLFFAKAPPVRAELVIPLDRTGRWEILNYRSIPANIVTFSPQGLLIDISSSASPLVYPIEAGRYASLAFDIDVQGSLNLANGKQGEKGYDDFLFRVGIVYEGEQTLNFLQQRVAASWIKRLFSLAPDGSGVDHIAFYNVYSDKKLAGLTRVHPLSDLLREYFVTALDRQGNATATVALDKSRKVLALWVSADGDDTASNYSLRINRISLQP